MAQVISLTAPRWVHQPDYQLTFFRDGDPRRPIKGLNLSSVVAIQTSKNLNDLSGTFTITVKDKNFRHLVREMDVVRIRLKGHYGGGLVTVMKGVVDRTRASGNADPYAAREDTIIEGRCAGKYLQVTSLFLPVWDPQAALPTAQIFGLGDAANKAGGNRPYDIFRYLVRKYTYGERNLAGVSGIPNSRYWLDHYTRFARKLGYQIPYLQFDEDSMGDVLKRMEITGFTEAWVDELGRVVYRQPGWDAAARYSISTNALMDWDFDRGDVGAATYVEVIPAGDPGIDSATAQALRAGRAPVPSAYLKGSKDAKALRQIVTPSFVIETNSKGQVTKEGQKNHWYRLQRHLGVRPQQITSPLIATQEQAQAQAEGLLRFYTRMVKGGTVTLAGAPEMRLGYTARVHGELEQVTFDRTFYIEGVAHDFVDGDHYTTTVTVTHGRDPWDPHWKNIALPRFDASQLSTGSGALDPSTADDSGPAGGVPAGGLGYPLADRGTFIQGPGGTGTHSFTAPPNNWQSDNAIDIGVPEGTAVYAVDDGTISSSYGFGLLSSDGGRFAGRRLHLETATNVWYYAHLRDYAPGIQPGKKVKKGDLLGHSGVANGVAHLHIACQNGNPKSLIWDRG